MGTPARTQNRLVTDYDAGSAYNLAYQTLFTNIRFNWDTMPGQPHTILLTTPADYAGKSVALANVAITAAQNGVSTILVDADMQSADLQQYFGMDVHPGLSDLLLMEGAITTQKIAPYLQKTFMPNLALLSMGSKVQRSPDMSRELSFKLKSVIDGLQQLLKGDEERPGLILFNSLPVLSGIDATLIGASTDQVFLLITVGQTTRTQARKAYEQLERVHAKVAGLVMLDA
ncbi:MAG: hypothetical protein NVS2B12_12700 [Ktedonobacteraceae bacterium]